MSRLGGSTAEGFIALVHACRAGWKKGGRREAVRPCSIRSAVGGKTHLMLDLAARITNGTALPDSRDALNADGSVIILSAEDDPNRTIRPRLDKASADVSRILLVDSVDRQRGRQIDRKCLRMSFCTWLKEAGVDLRDAQVLMRHSDPKLQQRLHRHPADEPSVRGQQDGAGA